MMKLPPIRTMPASLGMLAIISATLSAADPPRPNIIVILCDDLGYSDVGFNGSEDISTPALDRLAHAGTIFTAAYVPHPFCGPSRMGLMTGRYPHTFGSPFNLPNSGHGIDEYNELGIDVDETLISTTLRNAGYRTGAVGKWHMGITAPFHPNNRGFDEFYGFLGGGHKYFPEVYQGIYDRQIRGGKKNINEYVLPLERNGKDVRETEYITDAFAREAVRFVKHSAEQDSPFFLYLAFNAPHAPLEAKQEDLKKYAGIKNKQRRAFAAMVHAVDRGVGEIVDTLERAGELDQTLIVFLSDNGGSLRLGGTNRPLRDGKGSAYEGGYRVPMFFHWPGHVPSGQRFEHPISALDFYPTFAGLAGATIPADKKLDGEDLWDDFLGGRSPRAGEMIYAVRHRDGFSDVGARRDQWKASRVGRGPWKLFNVVDDIGESRDLAQQHPARLKEMVSEVEQWCESHTEPRWFHELKARDKWIETKMPNYEETFDLGSLN